MKKATSLLLALAMTGTLLAGCGSTASSSAAADSTASGATSEEAAATGEQVTIKLANWDTSTQPAVTQLVEAFEAANPDIKVEIIDVPSADYTTKLSVMLNGGSDVDAFYIKDADTMIGLAQKGQLADLTSYIEAEGIDLADFNGLAEKGQLADLTSYIEAEGIDLADFNGLAENFNVDGKQYAMPARTDYYIMYYNKDVFDAAGVAYPSNDWTWADFEEIAGQLTSGEGANKTYGAYLHTWQVCVECWGVQDGQHTIMDYQTGYDFFKPYYEMALRMQDAGSIQDYGTLKTGNIHYSGPFSQGTVGMLPMGTYYMSTLMQSIANGESSVNWGIATLPHPEGVEAGWTVGSTTPIAINAASDKQDAAWKLVSFITGEEGAQIYAANAQIPGRSNDEILSTIGAVEGMPEGAAEALAVKNIALDRPVADKVSEVNQMLGEEHGLIMLGELSVDEGLAEMAERAAEIVEE